MAISVLKLSIFLLSLGSALLIWLPDVVSGQPFAGLIKRKDGFDGMGVANLVIAIVDYLKTANAWDPSVPDKCAISMQTQAGGNCAVYVNCLNNDGIGTYMGAWSVCYVGGRQYFTHPDIGDFSVEFTKAGGVNGDTTDGLHSPELRLAAYNNWEAWNIDDILAAEKGNKYGNLCGWYFNPLAVKGWICGIPKKGAHAAYGISLQNPDASTTGYVPGWCTAHVNQYQKNEYGTGGRYNFDVIIYDAAGNQIGHAQKAAVDANGHLSITSRLPYTLDISVGSVDSDPVSFAYFGQTWTCDGKDKVHYCTLGNGPNNGYEGGDREGDFGFTCNAPTTPDSPSSISAMIVGDSITQGADGDWTWRYRLWDWLRSQGVSANFVGPYKGTFPKASPDSAKPTPPSLQGAPTPTATAKDSGKYNAGVPSSFPQNHFAMWGRQAAQDISSIKGYVSQYQPEYVLIMLGFNDMGWFVSGPDGTLQSVKSVVQNVQAGKKDAKILVANVVQRTLIPVVNEQLPQKTTDYNNLLKAAIGSWNTPTSNVTLVDVQANYACSPGGCSDGYDGLHPNEHGEFDIAQAFAKALRTQYGVGTSDLNIGSVPARSALVPTNFKATPVDMGIQVTWDAMPGARGYDLQSRRKGDSNWGSTHVDTNAFYTTWTWNGDSWEYQVRTIIEDANNIKSGWTGIAAATTTNLKTTPGPKNVQARSNGGGSITITWEAVTPVAGSFVEYAANWFDTDTPGAFIQSVGTKSTSITVTGLTIGKHYIISVVVWTSIGGGFPGVGPTIVA